MKLGDIKNWNPEIEKIITESWKKAEAYNFDKKSKKRLGKSSPLRNNG